MMPAVAVMSQAHCPDEQLVLVARLYWVEGLAQKEVARLANVSQAKVSRMLTLARERGLVRVTVPDYDPRNRELEHQLKTRFDLKDAVVIRSDADQPITGVRSTLGYFAARVVSRWLGPNTTAGIAGGRAMQALVEHMKPARQAQRVTVVQAMGNIDSSPGPYDAVELGRTLARRWGGQFLTLITPAILPDPETCRRFLELDQISNVLRRVARAQVALVGIGTLENSVFVERKVLLPRDIETLRQAGAVGEMLGRFYDSDGRECKTTFKERVVSLGLSELRGVPRVAAVVAGWDRSAAIRAAIKGGLIKALLIDQGGAAALLQAGARTAQTGAR